MPESKNYNRARSIKIIEDEYNISSEFYRNHHCDDGECSICRRYDLASRDMYGINKGEIGFEPKDRYRSVFSLSIDPEPEIDG